MANNYFQFKEFIIYQDQCAMKVTTDACLFGAITATEFIDERHSKLLDIGTGTGLLSLMIAQKNNRAQIDAVEIDEAAVIQAKSNTSSSAFGSCITVHNANIKHFENHLAYDFIFTNPPFFENDLKSPDDNRNNALHDSSLTLHHLVQQIDRLSKPETLFSILLPYHRTNSFIVLANENGWYCTKQFDVKQTEKHGYFRSILLFSRTNKATETNVIVIKQEGNYSDSFKLLLEDYYLHL
jgi:tRNA1Val (adenine37-N6)-methyltransferase